jgi:hypothetical protein
VTEWTAIGVYEWDHWRYFEGVYIHDVRDAVGRGEVAMVTRRLGPHYFELLVADFPAGYRPRPISSSVVWSDRGRFLPVGERRLAGARA